MTDRRVRVAAHTASNHSPARRLRIAQHIAPLRALSVDVSERPPRLDKYAETPPSLRLFGRAGTAAWQAMKVAERLPFIVRHRNSIAWLEREIIPGWITLEPHLGRRLAVDVDDAVWLSAGAAESTARIGRLADVVIAGNDEIAAYYASHGMRRIAVVPTAVDTDRFRPSEPPSRFTIGWIGSGSNLRYLEAIEAPLMEFLRVHQDAMLLVVCNARPRLPRIAASQLDFRPWSAAHEPEFLRQMSVGVMPLADDAWSRAKCAFKTLLYMASGIPSIVTPVGVARQILAAGNSGLAASTDTEWYAALDEIHRGGDALREALGSEGRRLAVERFSLPVVTPQLATIFRSLD